MALDALGPALERGAMEAAPLLEVDALTVALGGRVIVDGASLSLSAGARVTLGGPSGGGKTTLLRAVVGLIPAASGAVRFRGAPVASADWPRVRRELVLVAQRPALATGSIRDALAAPFAYKSAAGASLDTARAASLLARLGLDPDRLDQPARELSEGQQKRLALIRALLLGPAVLLLDEPTTGLDPVATERVEALLLELGAREGLACAIVTHDHAQAERLGARLLDLTPILRGSPA